MRRHMQRHPRGHARRAQAGMTLLEITIAVAIFAVVVGITAQSLVSYYMTIDMHEQQIEATQAARAVAATVREKREEFSEDPDWPNDLMAWVQDQEDAGWPGHVREAADGEYDQLYGHAINVTLTDGDGNNAVTGTNPVHVMITSRWTSRAGHEMFVPIATVVTNE